MCLCPICDEPADYRMNACSHSVCSACAAKMDEFATEEFQPFGEHIELSVYLPQRSCPLCRAKEFLSKEVREDLNRRFPNAYKIWFQSELFRDEDGTLFYTSLRKNNCQLLPNYDEDIDSLLARTTYTARTTGCYVGHHNLYTNPEYFLQWFPIQHAYPIEYTAPAKI